MNAEFPLTVVIPVYNRAERVKATLRSILAQDFRPLKIVLVDNGSTDGSLDVLQEWRKQVDSPDFVVTVVEEHLPGAAAARNRGLCEVTTPLTMFFDSDDLMEPGHCRRAIEAFDGNPGADVIGWDCEEIYPDGSRRYTRFADKDILWWNIFHGSMATQRYVATTELFRRVGGWNPDCRGWDDMELGHRILAMNPKIVKLAGKPTVNIIITDDSITGTNFSAKSALWEHALDLVESTLQSEDRFMRRALNLRRAVLAGDYRKEGAVNESRRLLSEILAKEPSAYHRLLYRIAVVYKGLGLPGISHLLRPLF